MSNKITDTFTIRQVADRLNVSRQSVYNKINKYKDYYEPYIVYINGETTLTNEAIELLKNNSHNQKAERKRHKKQINDQDQELQELRQRVTELTDKLIEEKDKTSQALLLVIDTNRKYEELQAKYNLLESGKTNEPTEPNSETETKIKSDTPQEDQSKSIFKKMLSMFK